MRSLSIAMLLAMTSPAVAAPRPPAEDKVVCKRQYQADTGSHFQNSKKVCLKLSEWKELDDRTQQAMRDFGEKGMFGEKTTSSSSGN